jgi:hypothetical protein
MAYLRADWRVIRYWSMRASSTGEADPLRRIQPAQPPAMTKMVIMSSLRVYQQYTAEETWLARVILFVSVCEWLIKRGERP